MLTLPFKDVKPTTAPQVARKGEHVPHTLASTIDVTGLHEQVTEESGPSPLT